MMFSTTYLSSGNLAPSNGTIQIIKFVLKRKHIILICLHTVDVKFAYKLP